MKLCYWILGTALAIVLSTTLPAFAQGRSSAKPSQPQWVKLSGRILSVDAKRGQIGLALYTRASSQQAPGKVPAELAQQSADLTAHANQLERQGNMQDAARMRQHAAELLCWREIPLTVSIDDQVVVLGLRRIPFDQMKVGTMLRIAASAPGNVPEGQRLERVTLVKDAVQVGDRAQPMFSRIPSPPKANLTFFRITGQVVAVAPLTLRVGEGNLAVDATPRCQCLVRAPLTLNEIQPGQRLLARVQMKDELTVNVIQGMLIFGFTPDGLVFPDDIDF